MEPLLDRLRRGDRLVADGSLGTLLISYGKRGDTPERSTLERPEIVIEIGARYVEAGADLIATNTFGASPPERAFSSRPESRSSAAVAARPPNTSRRSGK